MKTLGLIPARGGSKGIPQKNIVFLAGKPLLAYTCEAAAGSQNLDRVVLSTDDQDIARVGRDCGVEVPFYRPDNLAEDSTLILPVIKHALDWLESTDGEVYDIIMLLQPTSPLRKSNHIDTVIKLMVESDADTVVSVQAVPHNFNPVSVMTVDQSGFLQPYLDKDQILRRQEKPRVYARNGPAILAVRREIIESDRLYGDRILPFEMSPIDSMDIDDETDLLVVESLIYYQREKRSNGIN